MNRIRVDRDGVSDQEPTAFVVDDDPDFRRSLRWLIESDGVRVETFGSAPEFLKDYEPGRPGCLVLDLRMPGMSGLELQEHLQENSIALPVIITTGYGDISTAVKAMKAGAVEFLEKPFDEQKLLERIREAFHLDEQMRAQELEQRQIEDRISRLTEREREVMGLVVAGLSSKEIAKELGVSFKTIASHRAKIMSKMEARSLPHLIRLSFGDASESPLNENGGSRDG
jgi:RNA polymerase sigma factor (sigma-70 family)